MSNLPRLTAFSVAIGALAYVVLFLYVDRPTLLWIHDNCTGTWLPLIGKYVSDLARGSYIRLLLAFCFLSIILLDRDIKRQDTRILLYVCVSAAVAITVDDGLKYLLARYRPIMLFDHDLYGLHFFSTKWALNSTPSGHTVRAFAILTALCIMFSRGTIAFMLVAAAIGLSRVAVTDHYPSDVLFGALLGSLTALWTYALMFPPEKDTLKSNNDLVG